MGTAVIWLLPFLFLISAAGQDMDYEPSLFPTTTTPQFQPHHRCTNCPPILPTTNIFVYWSSPSAARVLNQDVYYSAALNRIVTNYLEIYYTTNLTLKNWTFLCACNVNPVVLSCTNARAFLGCQVRAH